jgi:hypothetical protein
VERAAPRYPRRVPEASAAPAFDDVVERLTAPSPLDRLAAWFGPGDEHRQTRFLILRLLGVIYAFVFLAHARESLPLFGSHGLEPAKDFLAWRASRGDDFWARPTIFWFDCSDALLRDAAWLGVALGVCVALGWANVPALAVLWILQESFVHVGQDWVSFGWEIQLCETGFLAIFLAPPLDPRPRAARPPPVAVLVLFRWLAFRIMLGAGLIKWRGDPCWKALTCLDWHFETQPLPNPLSPWFHRLPHAVHAAGVVFNFVAELAAPWLAFGPRAARRVAGAIMIAFQLTLIASGNLSFLNWLTIVPMLACLDDGVWRRLTPRRVRAWWDAAPRAPAPARGHTIAAGVLAAFVVILSIDPVANLCSKHQRMNFSYEPFALVNTYGAFGSVGDRRFELIFEGTNDPAPSDASDWRAYEFPCKPGDPNRRPCVLGPYHHRLDWQIWFAAMGDLEDEPWTANLVWKLLHNDPGARSLLANDPFPAAPPRFVRVELYRYRFAPAGARAWWVREKIGDWLPPVSADDPRLQAFLRRYGWL